MASPHVRFGPMRSIVKAAIAVTIVSWAVCVHACIVQEGSAGVVSLDCQGDEVVLLYQSLAEVGGVNIVVHPSVSGRVTLKIDSIAWDRALQSIVELMGHYMSIHKNTIFIKPL